MKIRYPFIAAALAALMLAGCGSTDLSSETEGKVTLKTKAAVSSEAAPAESTPDETKPAESKPEESTSDSPAVPDNASLSEKATVSYNGYTFLPGAAYADIKDGLGDEARPSKASKPCDPNAVGEITYHWYNGLNVEENYEGKVLAATISDADYKGENVSLACGLKIGDKQDDVRARMGEPTSAELYWTYTEGDLEVVVMFDDMEDGMPVISISVNNKSVKY
ncbi:MAG: hypothetical protein IKO27_06385 [Ruminococcus sp.]|nr:hypothetical protein [Ruminococcus sp.]